MSSASDIRCHGRDVDRIDATTEQNAGRAVIHDALNRSLEPRIEFLERFHRELFEGAIERHGFPITPLDDSAVC